MSLGNPPPVEPWGPSGPECRRDIEFRIRINNWLYWLRSQGRHPEFIEGFLFAVRNALKKGKAFPLAGRRSRS
jgi:hypothetical protein